MNYADDLVICCRTGAEHALAAMQKVMSKLKLTVNNSKTRVCSVPEEKVDFLGYTFGQCYSPKTGRAYLGTVQERKRVHRICGEIREMTIRSTTSLEPTTIVTKLNREICGVGKLLLSWTRQYGLSCCRWLRDDEAASVVANET